MNHYQLFGVANNASNSQIDQAYVRLCKRYRTTGKFGNQEFSFEKVQAVYKILSDGDSRRLYDESLIPPKDKELPKNIVTLPQAIDLAAHDNEWASKDYSNIKEWVYDFRVQTKTRFAPPVKNTLSPISTSRADGLKNANYDKANKGASRTHKFFIGLLISFTFSGIPMGASLFVALGMSAVSATAYSLLVACIFSIACLKASQKKAVPATKNVRKRRNYQTFTPKVQQNLTPSVRRNLMDADFALKCKIWGMPGVLDDAVKKFGQHNIDLGTAGEETTADLLEDLLKIPGTRIFHGLKFPGSLTADIDHAIINGNKIVFIDSKMWVGAHYKWIGPDTLGRIRRKEFKEIHTNFPAAVGYLSQTFNKQQVMAMTIIHSNNNSRVSFDNSYASKVMLINGPDAIREIGNWFSKDLTGMIDLNSMQKLQYQLK
jgi:curved DNA-binding protein CbpA